MLTSRAEVDAYFERFVRLFRSIAQHGMVRGRDLGRSGLRFNGDRGLGVGIDDDGRVHRLQGGNHL